MLDRLKMLAKAAKQDAIALYLAARDPRVPWLPKVLAGAAAAYALSPIDLIPDAIPVLGYLDELILLPLVIGLIIRLVPADLMHELRQEAARRAERPISRSGAVFILMVWMTAAAGLLVWLLRT